MGEKVPVRALEGDGHLTKNQFIQKNLTEDSEPKISGALQSLWIGDITIDFRKRFNKRFFFKFHIAHIKCDQFSRHRKKISSYALL